MCACNMSKWLSSSMSFNFGFTTVAQFCKKKSTDRNKTVFDTITHCCVHLCSVVQVEDSMYLSDCDVWNFRTQLQLNYCILVETSFHPKFYIQLVYKSYFGTLILLFGPFGQLRTARKKINVIFSYLLLRAVFQLFMGKKNNLF